jgi:hypothetical protein
VRTLGVEVVTVHIAKQTDIRTVFLLWCRLTGIDPAEFSSDEVTAFLARPQIAELAATPYEVLLDAGISAARRGTLPLERWIGAIRTVRPTPV